MKASHPPKFATLLLERLAAVDPAVVGDLEEAYRSGRSRAWYWRQALTVIALGPIRQINVAPLGSLQAVIVGWAVLAGVFGCGDFTAYRIAGGLSSGWTHSGAYQTGVWWPFTVAAILVSYAGFALSAWTVGRVHRRNPGPLLLIYIASVQAALIAAATTIAVLGARGPVPVPHPLFYFVSVTLPYQWRSGLLLVPAVMLVMGLLGAANSHTASHAHKVSK
jgi:hypothetical protein